MPFREKKTRILIRTLAIRRCDSDPQTLAEPLLCVHPAEPGLGDRYELGLKMPVHLLNPQCREDSKYLGRKELYVLKKTNTDAEDRIKYGKEH